MFAFITLTAGARQNLLSLQSTVEKLSAMQNRLATGNEASSALDIPTSDVTSASSRDRAADLTAPVPADSNPEGAKLLTLQTRQQLSVTDLSLADQASHALLMVF
jgi:hypothetical protein